MGQSHKKRKKKVTSRDQEERALTKKSASSVWAKNGQFKKQSPSTRFNHTEDNVLQERERATNQDTAWERK